VLPALAPEGRLPLTLDLIVERALAPAASLAADRARLVAVAHGGRGALRVYELAGEVLALGRYHLVPEPGGDPAVRLLRRCTGGRAAPWGEGFVGLSLILPPRTALVTDELLVRRPEQLLNRCLRGLLGACESLGLSPVYGGRDAVTSERRTLALAAFDVEATGAVLVDAVLAVGRDFAELPRLLDRADPRGVVKAALVTPDDTTSVAAALGRCPGLDEIAERLRRGHEQRLGIEFVTAPPAGVPPFDDQAWLGQRRRRPDLDRTFTCAGQLGVVEGHFALAGDAIREVLLAGDLIASSSGVASLEEALRGCPAERAAIESRVLGVLDGATNFLLGLGTLRDAAAAIARGLVP
jgi:lipoate-protein ligase A